MKESKYSVFIDNEKVAQHMTLEVASILVQALCNKKYEETITMISIEIEPEVESV